jgi:(R,R)-butanediol dehydrogenase/meso-butanediol dehydrogenase/diacetyl reductase
MRAARWHARGDVRIDEVPEPEPASDELLLDVLWCGICGTDLEEFLEGPVTIPIAPHPARGSSAPITLGHEVVGRVVRAAADGSGPPAGAVVIPDVVVGCGRCAFCRRHEEGLCDVLAVRGQTEDGGLAERMVARAATCLVVPDTVSPEEAALVEPASVAVRALRKLGQVGGIRIAVVGGGTVGQLVARVAVAWGARVGLVVDPREERRARALRFGAERACAPAEAEGSAGEFDAVVECSGAPGAVASAIRLVRRGGTVVALGIRPAPDDIPTVDLVLGEKRLVGSAAHLWDDDSRPALELMATGRLPVADLISRRIPLADVVRDGFGALADRDADILKVLVDCR